MSDKFGNPPPVYDRAEPAGVAVPAKWLTDSRGNFMLDPLTNKPYLVPAEFDFQKFVDNFKNAGTYASSLPSNVLRSAYISGILLGFAPGCQYDIQRSYAWRRSGIYGGRR